MLNLKPDPVKFEAFCWYHMLEEMPHPISDWHRGLIKLVTCPRIAIAAPRGFAKSTYFSFFYPLYLALEFPGVKIMLISATGDLATTWLTKIKVNLEANEKIFEMYGNQEGSTWRTDEIHLKNGSIIMAKGAGKQVRGFRPDVIIGDDLETDEMVASKDQRNKFDEWFWKTLNNTLRGKGQIIVIGTILHTDSFLSELIKKGRHGWETRLYTAEKDGKPLWPDEWPMPRLIDKKKEIGQYAYAQEFLNDPIPDNMRKFQERWFQYFDQEPKGCVYFTTVDPAIDLKDTSDCTAILTCAVDPDKNIYVVDYINKRLLPSETIDAIFHVYERFKPQIVGIEAVGFQMKLKYDLEQERNNRRLYPVIRELKSGGRRKELRIEGLQPFFESKKIFMKETQLVLKTQLLRFPSPRCKDDLIDALAYQLDIYSPSSRPAEAVDPSCFKAVLERRRNRFKNVDKWGNHRLRGTTL